MPNKLKNNDAFTFMELVVVLTILAVMSAVGVPALLKAYNNMNLKGEARHLYSIFQKARSEAIRRNSDVVLHFFPEDYTEDGGVGSYIVFVDNGAGANKGNGTWEAPEQILASIDMPKRISLITSTFTGTPSRISFSNRGLPSKPGSIEMRNSVMWYKLSLGIAGNVKMRTSEDGTWP